MKKYPKMKYPSDKETNGLFADGTLYIQEKLDGSNFRFTLERNMDEQYRTEDRDIVFGSRNVQFKNPKDESKQFEDAIRHVRDTVDVRTIEQLEEEHGPLTFFGEAMKPHTIQEYDWGDIPRFIGFDIWSHEMSRFIAPDRASNWFELICLESSEFFDIVTVDEWAEGETRLHEDGEVVVPDSHYGDVTAEGFMMKNPATGVYAKYVREGFHEKNKESFGEEPSEASGSQKLSYQYITNARIRKNAHKMIDEGPWDSLQMEMMAPKDDYPGLPEKVIRDMAEEEAKNIFMDESFEVDLGDFRSDVSSRCATVLRKMINENAL